MSDLPQIVSQAGGSAPQFPLRLLDETLRPDAARVILRPFTPAENNCHGMPGDQTSRVQRITDRVLALAQDELEVELERVLRDLTERHVDPQRMLRRRYYDMAEECLCGREATRRQQLLIGAYFVEEYSFEATALFNPSVVLHPNQDDLPAEATRLLFSLRAVGEGHISSIVFRTGVFDEGELCFEPALHRIGSPQVHKIPGGAADDPGVELHYNDLGDVSGAIIFPVTFLQRGGLEDLRLVRFIEEDGHCSYLGTYTAFSGQSVRQELLRTQDFATFELNALRGTMSATKGMALFPRRIDGRYAMLGRQDHENIWLLRSNELYEWQAGETIIAPRWPWEFVQMGNCGSPVEIDEGWLVITHGVGSVRNYCLGACLLDKRDPAKVIARSTRPLLRPPTDAWAGFVPNVVYSCGALAIGRTLLLPFGVADTFASFATVSIDGLLAEMQ